MTKKSGSVIGGWAFLIGVVLAVIFGVIQKGYLKPTSIYILAISGVIVGLLNISQEEVKPFLMSGTILVIVSSLGQAVIQTIQTFVNILVSLSIIFVPATIIVALKHVFNLSKN